MTVAADNPPKGTGLRTLAGRAFRWWWSQLRGIYVDAARRLDVKPRNAVILEAGERYWILRQRQRVLGQIDRATSDAAETRRGLARLVLAASRRGAVTVEIPAERALAKRIMLPAVAEGEIERVLQFEIARHFPFPAERVHFRHRVVGRPGHGTIEVELMAVPRELVAAIAAEIEGAGLRPEAVTVAAGGTPLALAAAALGSGTALGRLERALLMALVVTGLAALAAPVVGDRLRLGAAEREIAVLAPRVQAIRAAQARARRSAAETAGPLHLEAARPPLVAVLDRLTRAVPDGSWLMSLAIAGHELRLDGLSPSAATLALALEKSGAVSHVTFRSTITRDPATGLEHFRLSAVLPEPKP